MERQTKYHQILPEGSLEFFRGLPRKLGAFVTRTFLSPFPLDTYEHPLDEPIEPVTSWPPTQEELRDGVNRWSAPIVERPEAGQLQKGWSDMGEYLEREV